VATRWQRQTYLFVTNPPTAPWASLVTRLQRQRSFVLVYDLYPDLAIALRVLDAASPFAQVFDKLNLAALRQADGVIALGADMQDRLRAKLGTNGHIHVIPNWANGNLLSPQGKQFSAFACENDLLDKTVFLYAGNLGLFQDLEVLIEAVEGMDKRSKVRLVFVGDGGKRHLIEAAARRSDRILLFDYLPYSRLGDLYGAADVGMIAIEPGVEMVNMPSKTYSILASGRPFIAVANGSKELHRLAKLGAGLVVKNDAAAVRTAMRQLHRSSAQRHSMGEKARQIFDEDYARGRVLTSYAELLLGKQLQGVPESLREYPAA
jgi:glycosyltransferase involved in cell wall biosynthesis